ncbi:fibronectin type III domain-containing protein [Paenibacillus sp. 481]|nr:hypothetical protein [Paenibacillus sp. 481]UHA73277.1 hypothetical protein KIK04_22315 [Paenibacillus sp. 481]
MIGYTADSNYVVTGLSSKTTYTFTVEARDGAGNLTAGNPVTTTTD